jgi:very-short-patch-repair endonuclease
VCSGVSRSDGVCREVVDFFCPELALAIEIDGNSHDSKNAYQKDAERQLEIEGLGIQFLRFNDLDVKRDMMGVLSVIEQWIEGHTPDPSQEGNWG